MMYGCLETLQIFRIAAMLFGIFMEKISRVQAVGRKYTRAFGAYATMKKGNRTYQRLVYVGSCEPARIVVYRFRGGNIRTERKCQEQNKAAATEKKMHGNKYRDRRLLIYTVRRAEILQKKSCRIRGYPYPAVSEKKALYEIQCA